MRRVLAVLALCLAVGGAEARQFPRGGSPHADAGGSGSPSACDGGSSVCASFKDGQTFVTWDDAATGASGNNFRYRMYRSTSPITSGNYTGATLIASYILNNSAQLIGGNPDIVGGAQFTQANRQDPAQPMVKLTDLGTPRAAYTGLQVYTALGTAAAYYAVVSTNTSDASPSYIGSVGPIAESVATPQPIKYAASGSRPDGSAPILTPSGRDFVFIAHESNSGGGQAANKSMWGDYWEWFLTANGEGANDGRQTASAVMQDNGGTYPSLSNAMMATHVDTIWAYDGASPSIETSHTGQGLTPNPLVGPANRFYLTGCREIARILNWATIHYGTNTNGIHWAGQSMGAAGGTYCGIRGLPMVGGPHLASAWLVYPYWRGDHKITSAWPGSDWRTAMPFKATNVGGIPTTAPTTLGTVDSMY